jgi:hypothetical protein
MRAHWPSAAWHRSSTQTPPVGQSASTEQARRRHAEDAASQAKSAGHPALHASGTQWCAGEHASPAAQSEARAQPGAQIMPNERSQLACSHTCVVPAPAQSESTRQLAAPGGGA